MIYDVIIIGSGPAGLTAGIYTSRADLKTLIVAGNNWGGQLMQTTEVENFPGFPEGILGPELMEKMRKQAEKFGVKMEEQEVIEIEIEKEPFIVKTDQSVYQGRTIIVATGAEFNWLGLPSEQRLIGRGVSACATCDAAFFKNKKVVVVGGGDAAMEEALFLSKFASEVVIVHRRSEFRASKTMQQRVLTNPKIKVIWNTVVTEIVGADKVEGVILSSTSPSDPSPKLGEGRKGEVFACDGVFVAIGHSPATKIFAGKLELDEKGYIKRGSGPTSSFGKLRSTLGAATYKCMTNVAGVFVAGDVHDVHYKQAITAAGFGCQAALEAEKWLRDE